LEIATMRKILLVITLLAIALPNQVNSDGKPATNVRFFLDLSGSMNGGFTTQSSTRRIDHARIVLQQVFATWQFDTTIPELILWNDVVPTVIPSTNPSDLAVIVSSLEPQIGANTKLGFSFQTEANETCVHHIVVTDRYPDDGPSYAREIERILDERGDSLSIFVLASKASAQVVERYRVHERDAWPHYTVYELHLAGGAQLINEDIELWRREHCNVGF
jgi:hypothetical protein